MSSTLCAVIVTKRFRGSVASDKIARLAESFDGEPAQLRVGFPRWLAWILQRGVIAITLGRTVFISDKLLERNDEELRKIVRHEFVHVRQVAQLGLLRFLYRYAREYIQLRRRGLKPFQAYEEISFEREAREGEKEEG